MTTPRENLLRCLRRQGYEWPPLDTCNFCPSQVEAFQRRFGHKDYPAWFKVPYRGVGIGMEKRFQDARKLYLRETPPADTIFDSWGLGHSHQKDCLHMTRMHHPLAGDATLAEVRAYPLPAIAPNASAQLAQAVANLHAAGLAARGEMPCTLWEIAWYIRSMEDLMADMMTDDERATVHFDKLMENAVARIRAYAQAGTDIIQLGDDIGMQSTIMMSTDLWRKWLKPRLAHIIAAARGIKPDILIFYHSCGYILPFLDELIEVGVDILNPVQPECMEFSEVHRRTANRLSYWGTIGTQTTLPFGTPREVKETVWSRLRTCGKSGGIMIGPTHMVEPEVPWENLVAMAEAVAEFQLG
ncbi:MAG: uroporphyrinogen decarboxylase family protein [Kiritimatiellae bacterium]|nr:uroporphyrinogen decarboxylase family protein [Kiritimatiellia bacterium]